MIETQSDRQSIDKKEKKSERASDDDEDDDDGGRKKKKLVWWRGVWSHESLMFSQGCSFDVCQIYLFRCLRDVCVCVTHH